MQSSPLRDLETAVAKNTGKPNVDMGRRFTEIVENYCKGEITAEEAIYWLHFESHDWEAIVNHLLGALKNKHEALDQNREALPVAAAAHDATQPGDGSSPKYFDDMAATPSQEIFGAGHSYE